MEADATTTAKQQIRQLKKQKAEIIAVSHDRKKIKAVQRKVKLLKRETRALAQVKKLAAAKAAAEAAANEAAAKAAAAAAAAAAKAAEASV
jgi:ABC-type Mn2+/Zn2+ transport system ATPase subunit